ncbi:capsid protein [Marmot associated genomovirus 2]|nr:capsid protein [Marmot associated genomovirus 2]QIJ55586.1 capsid protein [Marmot associated genomovirus 2]
MPRFKNRNTRYRTSRVSKRSSRRKSYGRKKTKRTYRPKMTKKRILNTTSRKKRNTMLNYSNTNDTGGAVVGFRQSPAYTNNSAGMFVFIPTAQPLVNDSTVADIPSRTATTCYMRGFSERLRIQTSSGCPWFHRRICFTLKGNNVFNTISPLDTTPVRDFAPYIETSNGMQRAWQNVYLNNMSNSFTAMYALLFKGALNVDWADPVVAPVDTSRVSLKFDKTWTLHSGNASGIVKERKLWHPMNKNLRYGEDENGKDETSSLLSTSSRQGMGDYYIVDLLFPGQGASATDVISISSVSSLYWHEK